MTNTPADPVEASPGAGEIVEQIAAMVAREGHQDTAEYGSFQELAAAIRERFTNGCWECKTCGCRWRDNRDGTVSLFDTAQKSCAECEHKPTPEACDWIALAVVRSSAPLTEREYRDAVSTLHAVLSGVERLQEASEHARLWTQPGSCGIGTERPCRHERCIANATYYAGMWAARAAHEARELLTIFTAAAEPPPQEQGCSPTRR